MTFPDSSYLHVGKVVSACVKSSPMLQISDDVVQGCQRAKSSPVCVKSSPLSKIHMFLHVMVARKVKCWKRVTKYCKKPYTPKRVFQTCSKDCTHLSLESKCVKSSPATVKSSPVQFFQSFQRFWKEYLKKITKSLSKRTDCNNFCKETTRE